jgi:UDP-N-acetylglucosamine 2-epimerase (non-hydrolysing)
MKKTIVTVIGTRPEAIKMIPIIKALRRESWCNCFVVATAQHREMLDQALDLFAVKIDEDLNIMQPGQSLAAVTSRLFERLDQVFERLKPDMVLAQGDTTSVMVAAILSFYRRILFGHVEAGLRTGDLRNPFPEELNRVVAGRVADLHFAPTQRAKAALLREGVSPATIFVTGNTVIDTLLEVAKNHGTAKAVGDPDRRVILMTAHRRESFGEPMERIFRAMTRLARRYDDLEIVFPVHPNPAVRALAYERLGHVARVHLVDPLDYRSLVATLKRSSIVITDSGGLQEEAPALGKPVLVLREETERPEAIEAGVAKLVGTDEEAIVRETSALLDDARAYERMSRKVSPYGDGHAAMRICNILRDRFGIVEPVGPQLVLRPELEYEARF